MFTYICFKDPCIKCGNLEHEINNNEIDSEVDICTICGHTETWFFASDLT